MSEHTQYPLVDIQQVAKTYTVGSTQIAALKGVSFQVGAGEFVALVGSSGAGKSTLLNMISGVDKLSSGAVYVNGQNIQGLGEAALARWRGHSLGIVFQFFALLPTMTLLNNVMLPMEMMGKYSAAERRERAASLLEMVGLKEHINKLPSRVSGGQQQRAAVARAIANDPPLILGDEPTGNLDSGSAQVVFDLFTDLVHEGKTIVMVTQDEMLASRMPRQIELSEGVLVRDSTVSDQPVEALVSGNHHAGDTDNPDVA
ncbi:MAG: ATP-binding cassette domain-containing protein [Chloroflexi bacterium AL-W]|nr:ATP-binding cassette domain-containing protein [Chloroflexi bacterium AL-N1]NOK69514.1 ATP-binding cassette domain-containing protein [Chloroflexi bacterium AL-N10]NOK77479.1 ATP-binding cassette domain-containing protein [Chloroflexi bacterium AL-N5]NOK84330.1 ATP-binding cassette domain-containing protein [Chloroflexi bacterium AL-W]NOK91504.1 ATP-binding cassette domain-containing protein [Chloroflexi bacterium AL-N15]